MAGVGGALAVAKIVSKFSKKRFVLAAHTMQRRQVLWHQQGAGPSIYTSTLFVAEDPTGLEQVDD